MGQKNYFSTIYKIKIQKQFAYIEFRDSETAKSAVSSFDGAEFGAKTISVKISNPSAKKVDIISQNNETKPKKPLSNSDFKNMLLNK